MKQKTNQNQENSNQNKSAQQQGQENSERKKKLALRFSPTAWAKLLYFRDKADNEVGGFGITEPDDLLFVKEFITVKQEVSSVTVKFDDEAVADHFDNQVDLGRRPEQFARVWLHSHPFDCPFPSHTDIETFQRVFGSCQWAVMFILAENNKTYSKLRFNVGPGGEMLIPVQVDYNCEFCGSQKESWDKEYEKNVNVTRFFTPTENEESTFDDFEPVESDSDDLALPGDVIEQLEDMEPAERQFVLDELAQRPDLWGEESEVII